jgi:hypothetical protein
MPILTGAFAGDVHTDGCPRACTQTKFPPQSLSKVHAFGWNVAEHAVSRTTVVATGTTRSVRKLNAEWRAIWDSIASDVGADRLGDRQIFSGFSCWNSNEKASVDQSGGPS